MGWTFFPGFGSNSKKDFADYLIHTHGLEDAQLVGNHLWYTFARPTYTTGPDARAIGLILISRQDGDWGYKDMDESMGPCYYTCPANLVRRVPDPKIGYSTEWREKWERAQTRRVQRVPDGAVVSFAQPLTFRIRGQEVRLREFKKFTDHSTTFFLINEGEHAGMPVRITRWKQREFTVAN